MKIFRENRGASGGCARSEPRCALVKASDPAQASGMNPGKLQFQGRGRVGAGHRSTRFFSRSELHTLRTCDKVAAVCFRVRSGAIEFLLVQTRRALDVP